jgi:D-alanyl-D-alanine carboxypeptidase (penicillin-binding protein 5/6)
MLTRRREKRRFQLDVPQPQRRQLLPVRVVITPSRKRRRFRVSPTDVAWWKELPFQVTIERRAKKRRPPLTLAQRRQRRRLAWIASSALVAIAAIAGILIYTAPSRSQAETPASADSGLPFGSQAIHFRSTSPYDSLQVHTSANAGSPPAIQAQAAFLFDPHRGWILYQKNPDAPLPAASLTKIMTLLIATNSGSLDQVVTIGADAAALVNSNNSYMGVSEGERLTLRQLLYGLMLPGGNDAALAIADAVSGSEPAFVSGMNLYALQLGLRHTRFVSADGVSAKNTSSARDLAILSAIAIQNPDVAQITSTRKLTIPQTPTHKAFTLTNTNDLLPGGSSAYPGVNGFKTGYTPAAGYCMAFTAQQDGHLVVGVILGDPSDQARISDARTLLGWGFAQES